MIRDFVMRTVHYVVVVAAEEVTVERPIGIGQAVGRPQLKSCVCAG